MNARSLAAIAAALGYLVTPALAATGDGTSPTVNYFDQNVLIRSGETVGALGPNLMGDSINEYSGGVEFTHTDVSLPGNSALPVAIGRHTALGSRQAYGNAGLFGNWDLDIPHLHTLATATSGTWVGNGTAAPTLNRCSQMQVPPFATAYGTTKSYSVSPHQYWDGYHLYVPGGGDQTMLSRSAANTTSPTDGQTYPIVTKQHWQFSCLPTMERGAGEGFVARAPDGTKYQFDHMVVRGGGVFKAAPGALLSRVEVWILPTQVTDRFGNWVKYTYGGVDGWQLTGIASSDNRNITLTYYSGSNRIQTVGDGMRSWSYAYDANGALQTVTLPDNSKWSFDLFQIQRDPVSSPDPDCSSDDVPTDPLPHSGTITHPSGAVGTFTLTMTMHGRSNVPGSQTTCSAALASRYFSNYALQSKTLTGPGMSAMTWGYAYSQPYGSYAPCSGCVATKAVTITDPKGDVTVNTYGTQFGINDGLLLNSIVNDGSSTVLRTTTYGYRLPDAGPYPYPIGTNASYADSMSVIHTPQSRRDIAQQGVTFTQNSPNVGDFDFYARTVNVARSSTLGYSKTDFTAYADRLDLWLMGQVDYTTVNGIEITRNTYYPTHGSLNTSKKFGKLQSTYGYNTDGTFSTVADGLNQTTTLSNYKLGIPQRIDFADGTYQLAVVNNIGNVTRVENEARTAWGYGYDAMGRLNRKTPPTGDPVTYNDTTLLFEQVATDEYGLAANHWRQTITTGNAVTINYFDGRWRKRVTVTYDAGNQAATQRIQRFDYDPYNRTTFAAYPARSIGSITATTPGTTTTYDALGRVKLVQADSELGVLNATTQYLTGFQRQHTNPRNFSTTASFQAFDEPDESAIATATSQSSTTASENVKITIARDVFGKPGSINRMDQAGAVSVTRSYVYDTYQQLCKTIEPELGATIQSLDAANNVAWRATGVALTSTSCDQGSVPASKIVAYAYDKRNRLIGTGFGDGSPSIGRSYTPDGLPWTVVSNGSTWTYSYFNYRQLLKREQLSFGGTFNIDRTYDANAHLNQLTYPDGAPVGYAPNALGEANAVGGYASGITYHPNGAVAGYTLANGVVHTTTQNTRGLPWVNSDGGVLNDKYGYDENANVNAITDQQEGISTRSMSYDGLDRLKTANAPGVWGNASYSYDALSNVRTSVVGSRNTSHYYDANNRLSSVSTNGLFTGYSYDGQGNVNGRGSVGFYFDQGNRMTLANGVASYQYDGHGRRVSSSGTNGVNTTHVYSSMGQMLYQVRTQGTSVTNTRYVYLGGKSIAQTDSITNDTTYLYTDSLGSPVASSGTVPASVTFSCPAGWTLSGNSCSQGTTTTIAATVGGYTCPSGFTLSGSTCTASTDTTSAATINYSCPAGWSLSGTSCVYSSSTAAAPVYACPSGYTLSGATCARTTFTAASATRSCNGYGTLQTSSLSPTGYICLTQTILNISYDSPYDECQRRATSMGLVLVNTTIPAAGKTQCVIGPKTTYSCPAGSTLSGSNCYTTTTQAATVSSYTCSSGTLSGSSCVTTSTSAASVSYSCPAGQTLVGTTCHAYGTTSVAGTPYYTCPSGYTLSGSLCSKQGTSTMAATASYSCASGTLSGSKCLNALARTRYEAYGNTAAGTTPNPLGFTGHVNDSDTGLVYMQQRYYDPIAARFLSVDPIVTDRNTGRGFNLYEYVNSNPYKYTDPDGRDTWCQEPTTTVSKQAVTGSNILQRTTTTTVPGPGGATTVSTSGPLGSGQKSFVPPVVPVATGVVAGAATAAIRLAGVAGALAATPSELGDGTLYGPDGAYAPRDGMTVYRVWGGGSGQWGQFWTPIDPTTIGSSYRDLAGLPAVNAGTNLSTAILLDATGIVARPAAPLDGNRGGLPEYQVFRPREQLRLIETRAVSPPF